MSSNRFVRRWFGTAGLVAACCVLSPGARADAVWGKVLTMGQPDKTEIQVRIWGDEFYTVVESLDGYTLVRDPQTKLICYARLAPDGNSLLSTGIVVRATAPAGLGVEKHLRINPAAAAAQARAARADFERRRWEGPLAPPRGRTTGGPQRGNVQGLCLIVDFLDDPGTMTPSTVSNFCNQPGFAEFGDNGSVRDYYYDVSQGQLTYTNYVPTAYYRAAQSKMYYCDPTVDEGVRARELIIEALTYLNNHGMDFRQFDSDGDGVIDALNCFYAGLIWNAWAEGLWPHSWTVDFSADGVRTQNYQISAMSYALPLGTFCHENGHMLMGWPDLYDYEYDSAGVGAYCLMCYGSTDTNPCEPCAYLKYIAGWTTTTLLTAAQTGLSLPVSSTNAIYKFAHPTLSEEYYLIENRQRTGRDSELPDAGLALWHIDTRGSNEYQSEYPAHYLVTLVQADGHWDLENNRNAGDSTDLWKAPTYTQCTPHTAPNTNWWDGRGSGLFLQNIGNSAATMSFDFSPGPDCDGDNIPDYQVIAACDGSPACSDCNGNGVPDACDLTNGTSADCNANDVPDECELDVSYRVDDGTLDNTVGTPNVGDLIWLNAFTVQAGGGTIDAIDIAWGQVTTGTPTTLAIWRDPTNDKDPHDAQLLWKSSTPVPVSRPNTNAFKTVHIPELYVGAPGDVFFVGAYMHTAEYPAPVDLSVYPGKAWAAEGSNLDDLAANNDSLFCMDDWIKGVWLIRAHAVAGDCNTNGVPDACEIASGLAADCNANNIPDDCETSLAPVISLQPEAVTACAGTAAMLKVEASGVVSVSYQWRKNGTPIDGATGSTYTLAAVAPADEGSYDVVVESVCGSTTSTAVTLTVQRLVISDHPQNLTVSGGELATLGVAASGPAPITYQWRRSGQPIAGAVQATYTIAAAALTDVGTYDVVVTCPCSSQISHPATLLVVPTKPAAPSPADKATRVLLGTSLTWAKALAATTYSVYFGTTADPPFVGTTADPSWTPALDYVTTYYWKIVAHNSFAATDGPVWSFTTWSQLPAVPAAPDPLDGAVGVPLGATLSWQKGEWASFYKVLIGTDPGLKDARLLASTVSSASASGSLSADTTYYWCVLAKNDVGTVTGPVWSFTTAPLLEPNEPGDSQTGRTETPSETDTSTSDPNSAGTSDTTQPLGATGLCPTASAGLVALSLLGMWGARHGAGSAARRRA